MESFRLPFLSVREIEATRIVPYSVVIDSVFVVYQSAVYLQCTNLFFLSVYKFMQYTS